MWRVMAKLRLPTQVFFPLFILVSLTACSGATVLTTIPPASVHPLSLLSDGKIQSVAELQRRAV